MNDAAVFDRRWVGIAYDLLIEAGCTFEALPEAKVCYCRLGWGCVPAFLEY